MDYCKIHFEKSLIDLTYEDIEHYFKNEKFETDQIEFKSIKSGVNMDDKFISIQKSVCAFLNSAGGIIIWGAPMGQKSEGKRERIYKGELTGFTQVVEKDSVINKIFDSIIPLPNAIRSTILHKNGKSIIVFEIDSSEYSPHQTGNVYYMRIDGQNKPAPHHYIEALFKKIKYPNIEATIRITNFIFQEDNHKLLIDIFFFNWSPLQNEETLSFRIFSDCVFENSLYDHNQYTLQGHEFFKVEAKKVFYYGEPIMESETLLVNPQQLRNNNYKVKIIISFGGKYSPRKTSNYLLDFSNVDYTNLNKVIVERDENQLSKDIHDKKGMNKEKIIEALIKRKT